MSDKNPPIWAPWRIDFIRSKKEEGCFLCGNEIKGNKIEEPLIVARGALVYVILNRYPYNSGHLMIAPYRHIGDISDLTEEERKELFDVTVAAKNTLKRTLNPDGFNAGFNLGVSAGVGVPDHVHFHMVPRWDGDTNFMPVVANVRVMPEALKSTAKLMRDNWSFDI